MTRRRLTALLSLTAYLLAGVGAGLHLGHRHAAHPPVLGNPVAGISAEAERGQRSFCCGHHHQHSQSAACNGTQKRPPAESEHSESPCPACPDEHNADDCHACQFLAQKPVAPALVVLAELAESIGEREPETAPRPLASQPALPFPRAPPVHV